MTLTRREPDVLGLLLVVQNALCGLELLDSVGALVERALRCIPGVEAACVKLGADAAPAQENEASSAARILPIATLRQHFGHVALKLTDEAAFDLYDPFVRNMASTLALLLENRDQHNRLESELAQREVLVEERTWALRASNIKRDLALESAKLGEWDLDLVTGRARRNQRHDLIFGYDAMLREWTYEMFLEHVHPEDRPWVDGRFQQSIRAGEDFGADFRIHRADGVLRWLSARGTVLRDLKGSSTHILGLVRDITDEKREAQEREALLAREQDARQKVEAAMRLKDEFLATISHELRTPLTAVLGWTKIVLRDRYNHPPDVQKGLQIIERNAQGLAKLIEDILDISSIVTGKLRITPEVVSLGAVVNEAVEVVGPTVAAKQLTLDFPSVDEPYLVLGDPRRLKQVVWNLLSNATKFTPAGGRVDVLLRREGEQVLLRVSDTGIGIAKECLPHVFERFWQVDGSMTRAYGGLGLGLAIARHLLELHGGSIEVDSEGLQHGASFTVKLPAYRRDAEWQRAACS
jgi:PAS domain S-box-containing protein